MKKLSFTLFFSLVVLITAQGQNYSPIVDDNNSLFVSTSDDLLYVLHVDSTTSAEGKESFHFLKTIPYDQNNYCYGYDYVSGWTGPKLFKNGNDFYFFNKEEDSIKISPDKEVNETWKFYKYNDGSYIEATVTAKEKESFLTLADSVKTISLQLKDAAGNNIVNTVNGTTIKISKNYGIISTLAFLDFPVTYQTYELKGLSNPEVGLQLLTPRKIFNFGIGDEFHYEENTAYLPEIYSIKRVLKITGKYISANTDTIKYTYNDYSETKTTYYTFPPNDDESYSSASATYMKSYVVSDSIIYPITRRLFDDQDVNLLQQVTLRLDASKNGRLTQIVDTVYVSGYNSNYGCWSLPTDAVNYTSLLEGAGHLYRNIGSFTPDNERLVYYKKGDETWGAALTLSNYSAAKNATLSLFPNPLKQGEVLHWNTKNFKASQVLIYNVTGNKILETSTAVADDSLDLSGLQPGLYYVQLLNEQQEAITSKLLIR